MACAPGHSLYSLASTWEGSSQRSSGGGVDGRELGAELVSTRGSGGGCCWTLCSAAAAELEATLGSWRGSPPSAETSHVPLGFSCAGSTCRASGTFTCSSDPARLGLPSIAGGAPSSGALGGFSPRWGGVRVAPGERTASRGAAEGERVRSDSIRTGRGRRVGQLSRSSLAEGRRAKTDARRRQRPLRKPLSQPRLSQGTGMLQPKEKIGGEGPPFVVTLHCFCHLRCRGDNQRAVRPGPNLATANARRHKICFFFLTLTVVHSLEHYDTHQVVIKRSTENPDRSDRHHSAIDAPRA